MNEFILFMIEGVHQCLTLCLCERVYDHNQMLGHLGVVLVSPNGYG